MTNDDRERLSRDAERLLLWLYEQYGPVRSIEKASVRRSILAADQLIEAGLVRSVHSHRDDARCYSVTSHGEEIAKRLIRSRDARCPRRFKKRLIQGGRRSGFSRAVNGEVKLRLTLAQKHAQFLQRRAIVPVSVPVEDFSEPLEVHQ